MSKCILNKDGDFVCTTTDDKKYNDYPDCTDGKCDKLGDDIKKNVDAFRLPEICITGEGMYKDNQPNEGVSQMRYGNCGGGYSVGGGCDLKERISDPEKFPCPNGTKPFFYASKFDQSSKNNCNNKHKGYFSNIQYVCCDQDNFEVSNSDFPQPSGLPNNPAYCYTPSFLLYGDNSNDPTSSILVGRTGSGGSNEPTATHDGCDIDENKGYTKLKTLLGSANNFTWQNNTQNC